MGCAVPSAIKLPCDAWKCEIVLHFDAVCVVGIKIRVAYLVLESVYLLDAGIGL